MNEKINLDTVKSRLDFVRIFKTGQSIPTKAFILQIAKSKISDKNPQKDIPNLIRFGVTVSKKISKKAVVRNFAKRRLRSIARENLKDIGKPGFDYILVARPFIIDIKFEDLKKDFIKAVKKLQSEKNDNFAAKNN